MKDPFDVTKNWPDLLVTIQPTVTTLDYATYCYEHDHEPTEKGFREFAQALAHIKYGLKPTKIEAKP